MREGVPDRVDPVRAARRAARARGRAAREAAAEGWNGAQLYGRDPDDGVGGFGAFFLLLDEPEVYGLPPDPVVADAAPAARCGERRALAAAAALLAGVGRRSSAGRGDGGTAR